MALEHADAGLLEDADVQASRVRIALERIHQAREISFALTCDPGLKFLGERQDLEELLGNLLDNAAKWATTRVVLDVSATDRGPEPDRPGKWLRMVIDDDGDGASDEGDRPFLDELELGHAGTVEQGIAARVAPGEEEKSE